MKAKELAEVLLEHPDYDVKAIYVHFSAVELYMDCVRTSNADKEIEFNFSLLKRL